MTRERPPAGRLAFERLAVRRMPGFEGGGFSLTDLSPGVNVVHGPNASGKTTAARAIRTLLWPAGRGARVSLAGVIALDGERWEVDLDHGRLRWRRRGAEVDPPPLPPPETADRYGLALHDLLQAGVRGQELAAAVAREAAGGYDLEAARRAVGAKPRASLPRSLRDAYEAAAAEVRRIEEDQRRTTHEAEDLARLERELAAARDARTRLGRVEAAIEWSRCRTRLERAEEALRALPPATGRLTGEESERLAELGRRLERARSDRERSAAEAAEEHRRLAAAGLPAEGLPGGLSGTLAGRREELAALEREIERAERELEASRRRREEARRELGEDAAEEALAALRPPDWYPVLELARRGDSLRAEEAALEAAEGPAGEPGVAAGAERGLELLAEAARILRRWLREPGASWRDHAPAWVGAALLAAAGAAGGLAIDPRLWALAGAGAVLAAWAWADLRGRDRRRRFLADEHARVASGAGFPEPLASTDWRPDRVAARLDELEDALAEARAERERARREADRRAELEGRRRRLAEAVLALEEERRRLVDGLGLAPALTGADPAPLAALVHALCRWRAAHDDTEAGEAYLAEARAQHRRAVAWVDGEVARFGGGPVTDAASARGEIDALLARAEAHRLARERLARLEGDGGEGARAEAELARVAADRASLFGRLDLEDGDEAGLAALLDRLDEHRERTHAVLEARGALQVAALGLGAEAGLRERGLDELLAERDELAAEARREEELIRRLQDLKTRIAQTKGRSTLEDALARREEAAEGLREDRDRNAQAVVAWELADWLRERSRSRHQPAVVRRASELFAGITGGRFRLEAPAGEPPMFRAVETATEATRELDELSSGRRLQLLVAVRMGFVEEQERGLRPPLVLDETLANSDEASATALIEAVLELAREGRQVFYFTAQDDEVSKWRSALEAAAEGGRGPEWKEIDLLAERRLEEERRAPRRRWRPEPTPPPAPAGRSREEYADALGVPGIDPRGEVGAVHLWHVVDETEVLHGLLAEGIERWGQLRVVADVGGVPDLLGEGEPAERRWHRALARARCVEVLCRSWRQGRGRPLDRGAIVASGAVTEKFLDKVCDLADELHGAAAALVEALHGGAVPRFQRAKVDQLETYLASEGFLDGRDPLDELGLRSAALRELAAELAAGHLSAGEVDELLGRIVGAP